jgi:uncharacterized protein (TIGR02145 family)
MKKFWLLQLVMLIHLPLLVAQKKTKEKTITYTVNYLGIQYAGIYDGPTVKGKINDKKMDLPSGIGNFAGYKDNSGIKNTILSENYADYLSLKGKTWTPKSYPFSIAATNDFVLETAISMKRLDGNSGGALIRIYFDDAKKEFLTCSLEEYKREPYDPAVATVLDKSAYLAAKTAFQNLQVKGTLNGLAISESFKCYNLDYSKFNTVQIQIRGRILELLINGNLDGNIDLGGNKTVRSISLDKDASHDVYYDYLKVSEVVYKPEDKLSYSGNWVDGVFDGNGELIYAGGKLTGQFSLGNLNGQGKAIFKGYTFDGTFVQGTPNGKGKIVTDEYEYIGDTKQWSPNGMGKMVLYKHQLKEPPISIMRHKHPFYVGSFSEGKFSGQGTMHYRNGDSLSGKWNSYLFTGSGKLTLPDESVYEGEWLNGKKHGKGKLSSPGGMVLLGEFLNDGFNGTGKMKLSAGGVYEGQIKDGKPFGKGVVNYPSGHQISGEWNENGFTGKGRKVYEIIYEGGDEYCYEEGSWVNDKLEGYGTKVFKINASEDGSFFEIATFKGNFSQGNFNEKGVLDYALGNAFNTVTATWNNGTITSGKVETTISQEDGDLKISYEGELIDFGTPHGNGKLIDYDKSVYVGQFRNGFPNGTGTRTFSDGQVENGEFTDGEFKKPFQCKTATIGNQIWMAENLNVTTFRNGDPIPEARTIEQWNDAARNKKPAFCYYNNDPSTAEKFGLLYNWWALNDPRGLAPLGWRIPNRTDAKTLLVFLDKAVLLDEKALYQKWAEGVSTKEFENTLRDKYGDVLIKRNGSSVWTSNPNFGQTKLRSKTGWPTDKQGTDVFGFNAQPTVSRFQGAFLKPDGKSEFWLNEFNKNSGDIYLFSLSYYGYTPPYANGTDSNYNTTYTETRSFDILDIGTLERGLPVRCIKN